MKINPKEKIMIIVVGNAKAKKLSLLFVGPLDH